MALNIIIIRRIFIILFMLLLIASYNLQFHVSVRSYFTAEVATKNKDQVLGKENTRLFRIFGLMLVI